MSSVVVLIPYHGGCTHRARALREVIHRYARNLPRAEVVIADQPVGPWCKATAIAAALPAVDHDATIVIADGDVWAPSVIETVMAVRRDAPWGAPHDTVRRLSEAATRRAYLGVDAIGTEEPVRRAVLGGGIVVIRRDVLEECPLDRRFVGWGGEDVGWGFALRTLFPDYIRGNDELTHFWHPPQARRSRSCGSPANEELRERYRAALDVPDRMRALLAEAR